MSRWAAVWFFCFLSSQAWAWDWEGKWQGRLPDGAAVAITVRNGTVAEYRFRGSVIPIAYASVKDGEVWFSPRGNAVVTLTPASADTATYRYTEPRGGGATSVLTRASGRSATSLASSIDPKWQGTWGGIGDLKISIVSNEITHRYQGKTWESFNVSQSGRKLRYSFGEAEMTLTLRPDGDVDFTHTLRGNVMRGTIRRSS